MYDLLNPNYINPTMGASFTPPQQTGGPRGATMGADRWAEGMARQGFSEGQIETARRNRVQNLNQYGTPDPSLGQMYDRNLRQAEQLHGNQGLLQAAAEGMTYAAPSAIFQIARPAIAGTRIGGAAISAGEGIANTAPARMVLSGAERVIPSFARNATTVAGREAGAIGDLLLGRALTSPDISGEMVKMPGLQSIGRSVLIPSRVRRVYNPLSQLYGMIPNG